MSFSKRMIVIVLCYYMIGIDFLGKEAPAQKREQFDTLQDAELSPEDRAIIQELSLLEDLEYWESEDIDFLQEYDQVIEIDEDGGKIHE